MLGFVGRDSCRRKMHLDYFSCIYGIGVLEGVMIWVRPRLWGVVCDGLAYKCSGWPRELKVVNFLPSPTLVLNLCLALILMVSVFPLCLINYICPISLDIAFLHPFSHLSPSFLLFLYFHHSSPYPIPLILFEVSLTRSKGHVDMYIYPERCQHFLTRTQQFWIQ